MFIHYTLLLHYRKFNIVNPTSTGYEFEWSDESSSSTKPFNCLTTKGYVTGGKKSEVSHTPIVLL